MEKRDRFHPSPFWSRVTETYDWPRDTKDDDVTFVTHGRLHNLPQSPSKVVRIFMSSTFTDFAVERNTLMKNVFPGLRKICKEKYDLDFQVVDMRWGIRTEASVDHSTTDLCMNEIHECQRVSIGPTFVLLMSERYGGRFLPTKIPKEEMNIIIDSMKSGPFSQPDDLNLVEKWYKLDENMIPNQYILQSLIERTALDDLTEEETKGEKQIKDTYYDLDDSYTSDESYDSREYFEKAAEDKMDPEKMALLKQKYGELIYSGQSVWSKEEPLLKNIIRTAVKKALNEGLMTPETGHKYFQSITEEEIREGILKESNPKDRCLAFIRNIEDVNLKHSKAWRFVEIENDEINKESQVLMDDLKNNILPKHLPGQNMHYFNTKWSDNEGINDTDHAEYIQNFCDQFETSLLNLIERGIKKNQSGLSGHVYNEVLEHSLQCVSKVERFHGRDDVLDTVTSYLRSDSTQPLVIYGESGCGKTSMMAKIASQVPSWLGDSDNLLVIFRFLGTTPDSTTVYKLLTSVSQQLITTLDLQDMYPRLPKEYLPLKKMFINLLSSVPVDKQVVILLDSLDQLSKVNNPHRLHWFPNRLPPNVKVMASVLTSKHNILKVFQSEVMDIDKGQFIQLKDFTIMTSLQVMDGWLKSNNRTLSDAQWARMKEILTREVRPLYLRLVFDEVSKWKSFEQPFFNCLTISSCLQRLFRKLEAKHGHTIFSKALGYLSASKYGLTPIEMEDILSIDDEVLSDVFEYHVPPIRRLPSILWSRIRNDLSEYIVDRDSDGSKVMAWYHRQFVLEANRRYLPGNAGYNSSRFSSKESLPIYKTLADYFLGVWGNDKLKPFTYTEKQAKKLKLSSLAAEENRYVPSQPVIYSSDDIEDVRYNRRKVSELPSALESIHWHEDNTKIIAKYVCLNPEFMAAWMKLTPWSDILDYMNAISRESKYSKGARSMTKDIVRRYYYDHSEHGLDIIDWNELSHGTSSLILQIAAVQQCLYLSFTNIIQNPSYIGPDVAGKMLHYYGLMDGIDDWIQYMDTDGRKLCALVSPHMQLESTGTEVMFVLNNHTDPVNDAMWSTDDHNIALSVSSKFVAASLDSGEVLVDTRPRSVPDKDIFNHVVSSNSDTDLKAYYFASLLHNPWIYVFDSDGDIHNVIDLNEVDFGSSVNKYTIAKMLPATIDGKLCLYVTFEYKCHALLINNILTEDRIFQVIDFNSQSVILNVLAENRDSPRLLIYDQNGAVKLCFSEGHIIEEKTFNFSTIVSHDAYSDHFLQTHRMIFGLDNGQVVILTWSSEQRTIEHLSPMWLFQEDNIGPTPKYGIPHYVRHHYAMHGQVNIADLPIGLACTDTHLLVFVSDAMLKQKEESNKADDNEPQSEKSEHFEERLHQFQEAAGEWESTETYHDSASNLEGDTGNRQSLMDTTTSFRQNRLQHLEDRLHQFREVGDKKESTENNHASASNIVGDDGHSQSHIDYNIVGDNGNRQSHIDSTPAFRKNRLQNLEDRLRQFREADNKSKSTENGHASASKKSPSASNIEGDVGNRESPIENIQQTRQPGMEFMEFHQEASEIQQKATNNTLSQEDRKSRRENLEAKMILLRKEGSDEQQLAKNSSGKGLDSDRIEDVDSKQYNMYQQTSVKMPTRVHQLIMLCRLRRRYDMAVFTTGMRFILAARGGILDIFKVDYADDNEGHVTSQINLKVTFFNSIEAHSQDITRILPTSGDVLFLTSSADSTLKYFFLSRAGIVTRYIPEFDRTEENIIEIIPGENLAVTFTLKEIHVWEVMTGKIKQVLKHPKNEAFVKCTVDKTLKTVAAIDYHGLAYVWTLRPLTATNESVEKDNSVGNDSDMLLASEEDIQYILPDKTVDTGFKAPLNDKHSDINMLILNQSNILIVSKCFPELLVLNENQCDVMQELQGPFEHVCKMNEQRLLLVKRHTIYMCDMSTGKLEVVDKITTADNGAISDITYITETNSIVYITGNQVYITNPQVNIKVTLPDIHISDDFTLIPTNTNICMLIDPVQKNSTLIETKTGKVVKVTPITVLAPHEPLQMFTCTPDGKYMVSVSGKRQVRLMRMSDSKLLAWYHMYSDVTDVTITTNNWYVLLATSDRRLFVLIIADPDEGDHNVRIEHSRKANKSLTLEEAMTVLGEAIDFGLDPDMDSEMSFEFTDIEEHLERAETRLKKCRKLRKPICVLNYDDSSEDEDMEKQLYKQTIDVKDTKVHDSMAKDTQNQMEISINSVKHDGIIKDRKDENNVKDREYGDNGKVTQKHDDKTKCDKAPDIVAMGTIEAEKQLSSLCSLL